MTLVEYVTALMVAKVQLAAFRDVDCVQSDPLDTSTSDLWPQQCL